MSDERKRIGTYLWAQRLQQGAGIYRIENTRGEVLGGIEWYPPWKRFVFLALEPEVVWSAGCLRSVSDFLLKIGDDRKAMTGRVDS